MMIRQCLAVDCSKDTLDLCLSTLDEDFNIHVAATAAVSNNARGFKQLLQWKNEHQLKELPCPLVIEATGVYHEALCWYMTDNHIPIAVVLPNKIKNYCRSTDIRTITDKISARQIAAFGLVKKLQPWQAPSPVLLTLRTLNRERAQLVEERTIVANQQHASQHAAMAPAATLQRQQQRIAFINSQIEQVEQQMQSLVAEDSILEKKIRHLCTIRGVGFMTAVSIVAETLGFSFIRNARQLVCYAGLDVVHHQSGISVHKRSAISHRGNKYLRKALYFPAISAVHSDVGMKSYYERLYSRQQVKMKSYVAVQRKLLCLMYSLWKKEQDYKEDYIKQLEQPHRTAPNELEQVRS